MAEREGSAPGAAVPGDGGPPDDLDIGQTCARVALERKAEDVRLLRVGDRLGIAEYFVLATVMNRRHARAVRDAIRLALKAQGAGVPRQAHEDPEGRWSLYDYDGVVVHLFDPEGRRHFDLDGMWSDAPRIAVEPADAGGASRAGEAGAGHALEAGVDADEPRDAAAFDEAHADEADAFDEAYDDDDDTDG